MYYMNVLMC